MAFSGKVYTKNASSRVNDNMNTNKLLNIIDFNKESFV